MKLNLLLTKNLCNTHKAKTYYSVGILKINFSNEQGRASPPSRPCRCLPGLATPSWAACLGLYPHPPATRWRRFRKQKLQNTSNDSTYAMLIKKQTLILTLFLFLKVTGISEDQLLVTVLPGLPTTAEIFIVPEKRLRLGAMEEKWAHLDQVLTPPASAKMLFPVQCSFL